MASIAGTFNSVTTILLVLASHLPVRKGAVHMIRCPEALVQNRYSACILHQLPPFAELKKTAFDRVTRFLDDAIEVPYVWEEHESLRGGIERRPDGETFFTKQFTQEEIGAMGGLTSLNVIAWADEHGYRVVTLEETVSFSIAHPYPQYRFWIVALGSFVLENGNRFVPVLSAEGRDRILKALWFGNVWPAHARFLLIAK